MRKGFSLIECTMAGAILCFSAIALMQGIAILTRVAHENAQILAADSLAWDVIWKTFNEPFEKLHEKKVTQTLSYEDAPELYIAGSEAELTLWISAVSGYKDLRCITADVEWGPLVNRCALSKYQTNFVYRANIKRGEPSNE